MKQGTRERHGTRSAGPHDAILQLKGSRTTAIGDKAFAPLFSMMGYSAESAVALSTLVLLHQITNWVVGGLVFLWKPVEAKERP